VNPSKNTRPQGQAGGFGRAQSQPSNRKDKPNLTTSSGAGQRQLFEQHVAPLLNRGLDQQAEPILRLLAQARSPLPDVLRELGRILEQRGQDQESRHFYKAWLEQLPRQSDQRLAQARMAEKLRMPERALERYLQVLEQNPLQPEALRRSSEQLMTTGCFVEAWPLLCRRLEHETAGLQLWMAACRCQYECGDWKQAAYWARRALEVDRDQPLALAIEALVHENRGDEAHALELANRALSLAMATNDWALVNRVVTPVLLEQRLLERAETSVKVALASETGRADLHLQRSQILLLQNRLQEGFIEHQWRLPNRSGNPDAVDTELSVGPLSLVAEGTLGDTLLFSRYAPWLQTQKGLEVRLYVQQPLLDLLQHSLGEAVTVKPLSKLQKTSKERLLPLLSAPAVFGTCQEHPELARTHCKADSTSVATWSRLLSINPEECLIGINWHGSPVQAIRERHKSDIPLMAFEPLSRLPKTRLISLQKGIGCEQLDDCEFKESFVDIQAQITREVRVNQTAALIDLCDWIVTDDSGPAHLSGCLGVPTLVLLPTRCNWRWGGSGRHSPWYPNSILLRQQPGQSWAALVEEACDWIRATPKPATKRGLPS